MNAAALDGAIGVASVAGIAGLLLPSIDAAWDNNDPEIRKRVSSGEQVFFLIVATVASLQALKARSIFPLIFGAVLAGAIAFTYERALQSQPGTV